MTSVTNARSAGGGRGSTTHNQSGGSHKGKNILGRQIFELRRVRVWLTYENVTLITTRQLHKEGFFMP